MKETSKIIVALSLLVITGCQSMPSASAVWPFGAGSQVETPAVESQIAADQVSTTPNVQDPNSGVVPASAQEPIDAIGAQARAEAQAEADAEVERSVRDNRFREYGRVESEDEDALFGEYGLESLYRSTMSTMGYGEDAKLARKLLDEGAALIARAKQNPAQAAALYDEADGKLKWAGFRWPDSTIEEDAIFLRAEAAYFTDRYPDALELYGGLLKKYGNTRYLNTVSNRLFAVGQFWIAQYMKSSAPGIVPNMFDKKEPTFFLFDEAINAFDLIRIYDSRGPLADDSVMATAMAYFKIKDYDDAAFYFDMLRTEYSESEHLKKGHMFGLESKFQIYQGPRYDSTPLEDADSISDQAVFLVGDDDKAKRALREAMQKVEFEKAKRDWQMAQYYDNKKHYRAAGFYYLEIVKNHQNSEFAKLSRERYEQIKNLPPEPPNRFAWLTDMFEDDDD